ncbi:MAG: L-2-amino-thiazoline-4-carboxylic acid hydrolase [Acetatifactor muris]|nr:L-2-amino-thiazoline-4-carboxylic acid hydrolase [Acetatifactor muris]
MNYTYCETLMWHALASAAFQDLSGKEPGMDAAALKRRSKQIYREMAARTPDIGSLTENPLRICLAGGMLWLSIYEAADGQISEERFAGMVDASMQAPLVKASFRGKAKTAFTRKAQQNRVAVAARTDAGSSPFHWDTEVILGRDAEEYTIIYRQCGLCALDILSVDWMGGRLYRTKILASGGDCCDFYICKKDSRWDVERRTKEEGKL